MEKTLPSGENCIIRLANRAYLLKLPSNLRTQAIRLIAASTLSLTITSYAASVAIVTGSFYTPNLKNALIANGVTVTEISSYTAASLAPFDTVIQYGNDFLNMPSLETYVSGGGRLIETPWFWSNNSPTANLDIFSHGGGIQYHGAFPGVTILDAPNPLIAGVTFPGAGPTPDLGRTTGNTFTAGVIQVANWADGTAFIGEKAFGAGDIVGINMHVITSDTAYGIIDTPWATQLFVNAVSVPEPTTATVALLGLGVLVLNRRKARGSMPVVV